MMNVITLVDGTHVIGAISIQTALPAADNAAIKEALIRTLVRMGHSVAAPLPDDQESDHTGWGFFVEHDQVTLDRGYAAGLYSPAAMEAKAERLLSEMFPHRRAQVDAAQVHPSDAQTMRTRPIHGGTPTPDYKTPLVDPVAEQHLKRVLV